MDDKRPEKALLAPSKSFMAVGPTLHYSHNNVRKYWLLALGLYSLTCLFWSKIQTGSFLSFTFGGLGSFSGWYLDKAVTTGVSIFEYPWQILVLALLMGAIAIIPVLVAQLMSFRHSFPFIVAVLVLANLPGFAAGLLISCIAVACRPLRFRSRFIAVALCTAPQLLYWSYFGRVSGLDPIKWGFVFTPWIGAWIVGLAMAAVVLGIGHFTRYRPGLTWAVNLLVLVATVALFQAKIGFDELDYQLYVANNDPEAVPEFHDHSVKEALDQTINDPTVRKRYLAGFFYPTEPNALRQEVKREIMIQLTLDRWPIWFVVPEQLKYQQKRDWLFSQYDLFISKRPNSRRRMPIALYYKALLSEFSPDIRVFAQKESLRFYSDYPFERSRQIWYRLYSEFGDSPESIEARWRLAKHLAGHGNFEQADELLVEAQTMLIERLKDLEQRQPSADNFFRAFRPPPDSVMTVSKLTELQARIGRLRSLISPENRTQKEASARRLAVFVMLNPHDREYARRLDQILEQTPPDDPLRDNILLARVQLIQDKQLRAEKLTELHERFRDTDGGTLALYELARLQIEMYRNESDPQRKKEYLADARMTLADFVRLYPGSSLAEQAKKILSGLPSVQ